MKIIDKIFDKKIGDRVSIFILENPKKCILSVLLVLSFLLPGLFMLATDFSHEVWFRKNDPYLTNFKEFKRTFGSDDIAILAIHSKNGIFNKETVSLLNEVTEKMWRVPKVIRVESLSNFKWVRADEDEIIIDDFLTDDLDEKTIRERKNTGRTIESIQQYLISPDHKTAVIYAWPKPHFDEKPNYEPTVSGIRKIINDYKDNKNYEFYLAGTVAMSDGLNEITKKDLVTIIPIVLLAISIMLTVIFKSVLGVFMPLGLIAITTGSALGLAGWAGIKLNVTTGMIPNILMAICIADSIHLVLAFVRFRQAGLSKKEATLKTLKKNIQPTLLTSLSTSVGFFSLTVTDLLPISDLGFLAGAGTLMAWVFSIFLLTPLLMFVPLSIPKKKEGFKLKLFDNVFHPGRALKFVSVHKVKIIIFFTVLVGSAIYSALQNEINSTTIESFKKDVPIKVSYEFMRKNVGGSYGIELVFDSGEEDGIKEPEFLKKIDAFQNWLKSAPYITKVSSIVDVIKDVNRALNENQDSAFVIPEKKNSVSEEMMLYSMGLPVGMDLNHWSSLDNRYVRVMVMWTLKGSKATMKEIDRVTKNIPKFGLNGRIAGTTALIAGLNDYIVSTFFTSMIMAIILVSLLMTIFFRSIKLGILSMIPNVIPPLLGAGLMTVVGIKIDVGTILITSVCLGIAVDDTIYFLSNYNRCTREGMRPRDAVFEIYNHTGSALIWTTVILVTGFGCFLFASFIPNMHFGVMTSVILSMALIVDLTLLPAILLLKDKKRS